VTTTRRRFASLIAFGIATAVTACGGDGLVLPEEARPAAIAIAGGDAQSAPAGAALGQPIVVRVTDALNRPVEGQAVAFTIDAGGGQVTPASARTGADGEASASWTLGTATGQQRVQAKVVGDGLPATLLVKFSASAVSGAGAVLELVSGDNQTAAVGSALPDSLVVRVTDSLGNPAAGVQVAWSAAGGGSISPATAVTDADGRAAAERVLGNAAGTQTAQASSTGLTPVSFTHTADAANPTALLLISGDGQIGAVGAALAEPLVVRLEDDNGNGVGGKAITWVVATGGGTVTPSTATTNPNGFASTHWTLGANAGSNLLNAVFSGLPSVPFSATAQAGAAAKLAFTQVPVTTSAGSTITPAVRVAVQDAAGNTVVSATDAVTLAIGTNPGGGTLSGTLTVNAVNGVATFSNLSIDKTGNGYTLAASAAGLTGITSPAFDILTGNANRLVFIQGPTGRVVGQPFSPALKVQVQDAGGNPVLLASGTITLTSSVTGTLKGTSTATPVLGTATFSNLAINSAGTGYTLTALSSNVASTTSAQFDVAQAATTIDITGRSKSTTVPGENVTVNYDVDITAPGTGSLTGQVTVSDGTTSCTGGITGAGGGSCALAFPTAGTHDLTATYSGDANFLESASSTLSHTVNKANTTIAVVPESPDPSLVGDPVTIQWNLTSSGSAPLTGTVTLTVAGGTETCSSPVSLGSGSCPITFDDNGSRAITATYSGDGNYNGSNDSEPHSVKGVTSTAVTSSINPSTVGQSVTLTAQVTAVSGTANLGGPVQFFDNGTLIGQANLNGSGAAAIQKNNFTGGDHPITAVYQGSSTFVGSTSDVLTQTVSNSAPTADDDGPYSVAEDGTLHVGAGAGVLDGDTDLEGDPLTAQLVTGPTHSQSFTLNLDGSFDYIPASNFSGSDSFTYRANDGSLNSNTATVTITVTSVDDAPTAADDGPYQVAQDTPTSFTDLLLNDSDVEGALLTTVKASDPSHGTVVVAPDGSFLYTPELGFIGADSFTYTASGGGSDSEPATVTLDVQ
jgi:hypothetical protein